MRELAKRGHRVRVIAQPGPAAGLFDGVEYINFDDAVKIPGCAKPDVLVVSRAPEAFLINGFDARANFLWVHDVHVGQCVGRNMEGIQRADKIFCLSEWHKGFFLEQYPFLHPDTIHVTRNGIDTSRFAREPVKQGNRLIWASTPHRGVDRLIELLPAIRAQVPDAEVHVYYGFMVWERIAHAHGDQEGLAQINRFKNLLTHTPGVIFHDRVGQQELADAYAASKVWAYPTWFAETSCISAMEAQAAGCVPVATALAALNETVKHGVLLQQPSTGTGYGINFVNTVVALLKDEQARMKYAAPGRKWAMANLDWSGVAAEWEEIFRKTIVTKAENPMPRFGNL
jgi:glycosyltransferase involved in cell wall biosynthesis